MVVDHVGLALQQQAGPQLGEEVLAVADRDAVRPERQAAAAPQDVAHPGDPRRQAEVRAHVGDGDGAGVAEHGEVVVGGPHEVAEAHVLAEHAEVVQPAHGGLARHLQVPHQLRARLQHVRGEARPVLGGHPPGPPEQVVGAGGRPVRRQQHAEAAVAPVPVGHQAVVGVEEVVDRPGVADRRLQHGGGDLGRHLGEEDPVVLVHVAVLVPQAQGEGDAHAGALVGPQHGVGAEAGQRRLAVEDVDRRGLPALEGVDDPVGGEELEGLLVGLPGGRAEEQVRQLEDRPDEAGTRPALAVVVAVHEARHDDARGTAERGVERSVLLERCPGPDLDDVGAFDDHRAVGDQRLAIEAHHRVAQHQRARHSHSSGRSGPHPDRTG